MSKFKAVQSIFNLQRAHPGDINIYELDKPYFVCLAEIDQWVIKHADGSPLFVPLRAFSSPINCKPTDTIEVIVEAFHGDIKFNMRASAMLYIKHEDVAPATTH